MKMQQLNICTLASPGGRLQAFLNASVNKSILWVGIGNCLKSDDGVGVFISDRLKGRNNCCVLSVGTALENYIGKINKYKSDMVVLIDCMDLNKPEGYYTIIPMEEVVDFTINTHHFALPDLAAFIDAKVYMLGVQPSTIRFGESLSDRTVTSALQIIDMINGDRAAG